MQTGKLELQALGTLKDGIGSAGSSGQILSSTSTATAWIPAPTGGTTYVGAESFKFAVTTGVVAVGNVYWASRIFVVNSMIVNRIACYAISAGTGNVRMGIYSDAGAKLTESTTNSSIVAGLNAFTISADYTMNSGTFYYIALQSIANTPNPSYFMNAGYAGNTPTIRARYETNGVTDPNGGMASSLVGNASANALWTAVYRV